MNLIFGCENIEFLDKKSIHVTIKNSEKINLQNWFFEIEFSLNDINKGCFIFDKRNGQWHRNYCFGYITEEWFKHHPTDIVPGKYIFVDVGDGSKIEHELNNGVGLKVDFKSNEFYRVWGEYSNNVLSLGLYRDHLGATKICFLNNIKGDGNLVIGSMGEPYTDAFEQYGLGRFFGTIKSFKLYSLD